MPVTNILLGAPETNESTRLRPVASASAVITPEGVITEWRA